MTINQAIIAAVTPIVPVCVPDFYTGTETTYCTFGYMESPQEFGEEMPSAMVYLAQLHFHCPLGCNPTATKKALKRALATGDFTYPTVTDASDLDGFHFVFEFEYVDGDV